ncbi:Outer membrane receptor proteins, mostly Fe transport [Desulfatibacillum alkenivorans DSM 16219]|uniref:Outer membrane receptor proteins, mostly Fe transport n=1 Tax=Desulfatibacillum alkenivorans DSM 16219 TaxID=1121393 RepID=A0A1M6NA37_9BACT|nr:TonB-dependent receptor plug domain-containing protein [Desulfatibacillum alkenivorans]SHJ92436.1 Outer membrane receptor proteins, mostly Fe transport [Desulfatibacillum alkenivorans DSM 16219]
MFCKNVFKRGLACFAAACLLAAPCASWAEQEPAPQDQAQPAPAGEDAAQAPQVAYTMEAVVVKDKASSSATGESVIDQDLLQNLPAGNGSINEMLKVLPDIQFSEDSRSSLTGGEILPPNVSISGGRFYENNFSIDGIGNNSLLDPAADNPNTMNDVPGHPQEFFLDADLVEQIKVYDSNVPASYGGFTGGVVDATTKRPGLRYSGSVKYRTTRSDWASFHIGGGETGEYDFEHSDSYLKQPEFEKHEFAAIFNAPINDSMGVIGSYNTLWSDIPLRHLDGSKTQTRRNQNFFAKYAWDLNDSNFLDISAACAPYEGKYFVRNAMNSDYIIKAGGARFLADYTHAPLDSGPLKVKLSYRESENTRESPQHWRLWATTDTFSWGKINGSETSAEGGFGDIEKTQKTLTTSLDKEFNEFDTWRIRHSLQAGFEYEQTAGTFTREDTTYVYKDARISPDIICDDDCFDAVAYEQFFTTRNVYPEDDAEANINLYAWYLSDKLDIWRISMTPGLRVTVDDYMDNVNLAPRFFMTLDVFDNEDTVLSFGANRYYARALLTYKLREAKKPFYRETRTSYHNQLTDWELSSLSGSSTYSYSELDTPHSDEIAVGIDQALLTGTFSAKYVSREGKDEFARDYGPVQSDGLRYFTMTNDGESSHESYRASWEKSWKKHFLSMSCNWQESKSSNPDYDTTLEDDETSSQIWYKGDLIYLSELPAANYNRPFIGKLTYSGKLPWGFTFTSHTSFREGYLRIEDTGDVKPLPDDEGGVDPITGDSLATEAAVYDEVQYEDAWIFDVKLSWTCNYYRTQKLTLSVEVENLFDEISRVGSDSEEYEMGRLFWAEAKWEF